MTGESDEIEKVGGSSLMSGSFVVSGQCCARLVNVGEEAYIYKLTKEAKEMGSGEQSEMVKSINQIVKWMGIAIIPIGLILFYQSYWINHETFKTGIVSTVAAITGMIPEGFICSQQLRLRSVQSGSLNKSSSSRYEKHRGACACRCPLC